MQCQCYQTECWPKRPHDLSKVTSSAYFDISFKSCVHFYVRSGIENAAHQIHFELSRDRKPIPARRHKSENVRLKFASCVTEHAFCYKKTLLNKV